MPRLKPKAQRLAPPSSTPQSERDSHPHPTIEPANYDNSDNLAIHHPEINHAHPTITPNPPNKSGVSDPSPNSIPGTVIDIDPLRASHSRPSTDAVASFHEPNSSLLPCIGRSSSSISRATSDTASVALEDCVPELEEFDDIVLPAMKTRPTPDARKLKKRPSPPRHSNGRFSNGSVAQSSTSRARVSAGSRMVKTVEADPTADPTPSMVPAPALEVSNPVRAETVDKRRKSSFMFVSDDEAKSVFDHDRASTDGSGVGIPQGDADRNKFGEYWKELETVSIRRSAHSKTGQRKGGQKRMRQDSNKAPSLDPRHTGSSSKKTESTGRPRPTKQKQGKSEGGRMKSEIEGERHPITEENIDGGDAIAVDVNWRRKPLKKARSTFESFRRSSTKQRSQWQLSNTDNIGSSAGNREGNGVTSDGGTGMRLQNGLDDGEDTGGSTGFSESDGQACMQCGGHGKASKMVLCDVCSDGCHTFCMRPARVSVPLGVWICPRCHTIAKKHKVHLSNLPAFLENNSGARG